MSELKLTRTPAKMTARELLVSVAGPEHDLHSVVGKNKTGMKLSFKCSCGAQCDILAAEEAVRALQNVPEDRFL